MSFVLSISLPNEGVPFFHFVGPL